jgi:hypothetical protein
MRSQVKKYAAAAAIAAWLALSVHIPPVHADDSLNVDPSAHAWGSKRMEITLWGIGRGDLDGNGTKELVLLEKSAVWVARREGDNLVKDTAFSLPQSTEGLRLFLMDVDGDGRDDIIISAVAYGNQPSSLLLRLKDGRFEPLLTKIPWHLRALPTSEGTVLVGQRASNDDLFDGKIYRLGMKDGALKAGDALRLRRTTRIFDFTLVPPLDEGEALVTLKTYASLKAYRQQRKRWKKFWSSSGRFGGTLRQVERTSRPPLQDLPRYRVPVGHEPIALKLRGTPAVMAARHDMPLKNIIGRGQLIKGGRLIAFARDPSLGFTERFATQRLPGFIADYCVDTDATGRTQLYVALQTEPEVFNPSLESTVLIYDLP